MTFRGFDPRTRFLRWGLFAIAVGVVLGATGPTALRAIGSALALEHDKLPWYATRLLAFLAYYAMAGSVIYGLLLSTKVLDAIAHRPITFTLHQDLAAIGLGLAGVHGMLLTIDRSVPQTLAEVLIPFAGPYRPIWVGFGQIAFWIALVVVASFYLRRRIGQRSWRLLHYLTFFSFMGVAAHGIAAGTDSAAPWAWLGYVLTIVTVAFLFTYRIVTAIGASRTRRASAPAARPAMPLRVTVAASGD